MTATLIPDVGTAVAIEPRQTPRRRNAPLLPFFWCLVGTLIVLIILDAKSESPLSYVLGGLIAILALIPSYLWFSGRVSGPPLFPMCIAYYIFTFAVPFWIRHKSLFRYAENDQLTSSITVMAFIVLSTTVWLLTMRRPVRLAQRYRVFEGWRMIPVTLAMQMVGCSFAVSFLAQWLPDFDTLGSAVQSVCNGMGLLGSLFSGYLIYTGQMRGISRFISCCLIAFTSIAKLGSLIMIHAVAGPMLFCLGFLLAGGRPPYWLIGLVFLTLSFLHMGKDDMRGHYWFRGKSPGITPLDYPSYFAEWQRYSVDGIFARISGTTRGRRKQSFLERASNIHMLALVQSKTPTVIPFFGGATYTIIPELLVPRLIMPEKLRTHEGTYMLSMRYGLQTRKATYRTTIAFDLISEAYANFSYPGVAAIAVLLGWVLGMITRAAMARPGLSVYVCIGFIVVYALNLSAASAGVFCATSFQNIVVVCVLGFLVGTVRILNRAAPTFAPTLSA